MSGEDVAVVLPDGAPAPAVCYNLPEPKLEAEANVKYARSLLLLAGGLGFPDEYLQQIRNAADQS